jgi:hypothetical protein
MMAIVAHRQPARAASAKKRFAAADGFTSAAKSAKLANNLEVE